MRRILIAAGMIVMASPFNGLVAQEQKPRIRHTSDYASAPATLQGLRDAVDAIVLGRVESSVVRTFGQHGRVATLHTVRVMDVVKGDNGIRGVGSTFEVEEAAGELELPDKIVTVNPGVTPLRPGDTQVFFLRWHHAELHYALAYGPQASFRVRGSLVEAPTRRGIAARFSGMKLSEFLAELRR